MTTAGGERFEQLSRLFDAVVEAPKDEREALIRWGCEGDEDLESELRQLLAADSTGDPDGFVSGVIAAEAAHITGPSLQGHRLGAWAIEEPIGEGGMGTVYRARRADGEYEATAAIKLVRGGVPSPTLNERVRSERQILAGLSHPGVAQLLDGGTTEDGTPYLVLEHVDGLPITECCDERGLDVDARLRLFLKVCDAVTYAHGALVAHRDLKPSNILVTAEGEPKLLDFGIAKLVDTVSEGDVTQSYGLMTPAYASPEQVLGQRAGVAADIYSLGVLLFELLTGHLPIETRGLTPPQVAAKITTEVPPLLSATATAGRRRRLSGDLDAIVSRALRKEPERRYDSVAALGDDIRLHLEGLPINTRRDDWAYRTSKALKRNAGVVSAGMLLLIVMVTFFINAIVQSRAVARERDRTAAERETAVRVSQFLEDLLTEADPNQATSLDMTAREVLDRGAQQVMSGLQDEPTIQASLATVMGRVYNAVGEYDAAEPLLDSAVAVLRRESDATPDQLGDALIERASLAYSLGDYQRSFDLSEEALATYQEVAEGDDVRLASAYDWLGANSTELGRLDDAERYTREMVEMYRRIDPEPNEDLASAMTSYTDVLRAVGKVDLAVEVGEEALAMTREVYGPNHLEVAFALNQMASSLRAAGRYEEAVPLVEEGLAIRRANFDGPHVEVAASLGNLANVYLAVGRNEEAEAARRESDRMLRTIFPEPHPYTAASSNSLASLLAQLGEYDEAIPLFEESIELHREVFPAGHPNLAFPLTGLGRIYLAQDRFAEAEPLLREAYEIRSNGLPEGHWEVAPSALELGRALDGLGRETEAEAYLQKAYDILMDNFGSDDTRTAEARDALRRHFLAHGLNDRAAELTE